MSTLPWRYIGDKISGEQLTSSFDFTLRERAQYQLRNKEMNVERLCGDNGKEKNHLLFQEAKPGHTNCS